MLLYFKDKLKENNKSRSNGEAMRCRSCDSMRHLLLKCPYSWENMERVEEEGNTDDNTILLAMGEVNCNLREERSQGNEEITINEEETGDDETDKQAGRKSTG